MEKGDRGARSRESERGGTSIDVEIDGNDGDEIDDDNAPKHLVIFCCCCCCFDNTASINKRASARQ
mgnify:FL=1